MLSRLRGSSSLIAVPVSSKSVPVGAGSMALLRRVVRSGFGNSRFRLTKYRAFNVPSISVRLRRVVASIIGRSLSLLSPMASAPSLSTLLVKSLEAQGVPSKQAEAITSAITEILNDSLKNVVHSFVSKAEMQKEHHFSLLQHETEKLRGDIENMCSELRYEIDKVTAGQRLDLNLKKGRIFDELANQNAETTNLTNKLDQEIHALRAQLEAAQYEVIKYCIGTLVSISAIGLAVVRILM